MRDRTANGTVLRRMRDEWQMTQVHAAELAGISLWHLSRIENDRDQPSDQLALRLAGIYQCSVDDFSSAKATPESVAS